MNLDDELRAALRREDPSPGFAQRAVARAKSNPEPTMAIPIFQPVRISQMIWAAALAAMLVIGLTATSEYRQRKAERAGRDAVLALRITAEKLNMTRDKVLKREEN
ncbi:MAG: hypothetical protein LAO55_07200 [Acidobacteriia bacterium]|nr:hypothetical protein [Terriglobia bacterium]